MPYEYRRLTPEQREAVRGQRIAAGYPLHAPPHPFRDEGHYLITAVNFEHAPLMADLSRRTDFETQLHTALNDIAPEVYGWVILPNHYHVLISVTSLDLVSATLKQLHGSTSHAWNREEGLTGQRRVWYKFTDRFIRNERHFYCALNYIHINPVKHGYTTDPYDWPWSSIHNYLDARGRDWLRDQWLAYPPSRDFGQGWDE